MRQTFTDLQTQSKDYISQSAGTLAGQSIANYVKKEINKSIAYIKTDLKAYIIFADDYSFTTVDAQQAYDLPVDFSKLDAATLTVGGIAYPLRPISSRNEWNRINEIDFSGITIPQYIFVDKKDFSIYPIPQDAYSGTLTYVPDSREMINEDYTTGTVTATNDDETITGAGTTWTAPMVGRWFKEDADANWYRLETFTSTTSMELDRTYQGTTTAGGTTYTIGEMPDLPGELHEYIPHRVAAQFYALQKDFSSAQGHTNFFKYGTYAPSGRDLRRPSGGIEGAKARYAKRDTGALVYRNKVRISRFYEAWSTTLSSTI